MTIRFKSMIGLLLGTLVLISTACNSGHLSRSQAKSQLDPMVKNYYERTSHDLSVDVGTVADCEPSIPDYDPVKRGPEYNMLKTTGYLTIHPLKKSVWNVELTELGNKSIRGKKYAHNQKGDCDQWQVSFPLSKYDHLDVTGVLEDGVHAKVDASLTFVVTPVGIAVRKVPYGEFDEGIVASLLGNLVCIPGYNVGTVCVPSDQDRYVRQGTFEFEKYDDGWKLSKDRQPGSL